MTGIDIYEEDLIRQAVGLNPAALSVIENAFRTLSKGGVQMPPVMHLDVSRYNGEIDSKTAFIPGMPYVALKVSCGFFDNPDKGLPSLTGLMNVFDAETGQVAAILLDNGYLTDIRTALAGALSVNYLSRKNAKKVTIIGTGLQARLQAQALKLVRDYDELTIWGRNTDKAEAYAKEMSDILQIPVKTAGSVQQAVADADIIITTTPSSEPLIKADWLREGTHITAMGSDAPTKNELDPNILARSDIFVCDSIAQSEMLGELRSAKEKGLIATNNHHVSELSEIISGNKAGRENDRQISVCDLTGLGVQDTAIACYAIEALQAGQNQKEKLASV